MKLTRMKAASLLALAIGGISLAYAQDKQPSADEQAIRTIVMGRLIERDKSTAANLDWENAFGFRIQGLAEKQKFMSERVGPTLGKAAETISKVTVNIIAADAAVADKYWTLTGQTHPETGATLPDRVGRTTFVLRKDQGKWLIVVERIADLRQ